LITMPSFMKWYSIFFTSQLHSNWGWKIDYKVKLRPKITMILYIILTKFIFLFIQQKSL
jgi:hypothetical protein